MKELKEVVMATVPQVNKALKAAGLNVQIVRNLTGGSYYYFIDDGFDKVPSIYDYSLRDYDVQEIVDYVKRNMEA